MTDEELKEFEELKNQLAEKEYTIKSLQRIVKIQTKNLLNLKKSLINLKSQAETILTTLWKKALHLRSKTPMKNLLNS